jgi:hypothetical protein
MFLEELAQYLETEGTGNYDPDGITGDIFVAVMPPKPDAAIAIFPTGGSRADGRHAYDYPTVQVRVRGTLDPRPAYTRLQGIYNLLHGLDNIVLSGGTHIFNCNGLQSAPQYIGADSNQRHEFVINFEFHIRAETGNRV